MQNGIGRYIRAGVAFGLAFAAGWAHAASTGTTALLRVTGEGGGTGFGDYVSDANALDSFYRFYVEVPPGTSRLDIDLFDADVGAAGNADDTGNRDRLRNAFNTTVTYRVRNPAGALVTTNYTTGSTTSPANADNAWTTLFSQLSPAAGHWLVEVDSEAGDDVNAFGLRAHDGDPSAGGTELDVYADGAFQIGINPLSTGVRTSLFTYYPYVTHGCTFEANDFDYDSAGAVASSGQNQAADFTSRTGDFTTTFANATLSDNDAWNAESAADSNSLTVAGPSGTEQTRDGYGLWTGAWRINEVSGESANFATLYTGPEQLAAPPPTANPQANTFRVYFPTDAGTAPLKPYLAQYYAYASGPNPPVSGQNTVLDVSIVVVNPGPQPITFSATNLVSTRVGGPTGTGNTNAQAVFVGGSATVDQGTVVATPANLGTGLLTWNPGVINGTDAAVLRYQVRVTPANGNTAGLRRINGEGNSTANDTSHGTRARFVDGTGNTTQAQATYTVDGLCGLSFLAGTAVPVPVTVAYVRAARVAGGVDVAWRTSTETRNGGFDVYGRRGASWQRLTAQPVPSRNGDSVEPQDYQITLPAPADLDAIAIEDIASDGTRTRHPAVAIGSERGSRAASMIDWSAVRAASPQRAGAGSGVVHLEVRERGVHRVRVADLLAAGQDLRQAPTAALALIDGTGPVPVRIRDAAGGVLGADATLEFLGEPRPGLYGDANRYTVVVDSALARRPEVLALDREQAPRERDRYRAEVELARDRIYTFAALADDPWYDTLLTANGGTFASYDFTLEVDAPASIERATVALTLEGETEWPQDQDHRLAVSVNGVHVAEYAFDGRRREQLRFELPDGTLHAGANTVTVRLTPDVGVLFDRVRLERVALEYERALVAVDGRFAGTLGDAGDTVPATDDALLAHGFEAAASGCDAIGCTRLSVTGMSGEASAWLRDGAHHWLLIGTPRAADHELVLPREHGELFVAQEDRIPTPTLVAGAAPAPDPSPGVDLLIVSHPDFAGDLASFVAAREAQGLDVDVVTTDAIYARHSAGRVDPDAIRAQLALAHARGARYALLVGGDHYDYENRLGTSAVSHLPTRYTHTDADVRYAPSDALLGDVDGDELPDLAVGRWPVRTAAQLSAVIGKTLAYDRAPHAGRALFAADDPQDVAFDTLSGYVASGLAGAGWTVDRVDVTSADAASERAALIAALHQGRALTHFVGHAGVDRWTFEPLLLAGGAQPLPSLLSNGTVPTIVAQWGCWSSYFVSPLTESLAHAFLLDADGGAAAVIGAATRIRNSANDDTLREFMLGIGGGHTRLGDAVDAMRRATAESDPDRRDLIHGIQLLGDPTLRLRR